MKLLTSLVILTAAAACAACASQAPATSTMAGSSHESVAPAASNVPPAASNASPTASSASPTASAAPQKATSALPEGYKRVVMNGEEKFCITEYAPNSRVDKHTTCLTKAQLDAKQNDAQSLINTIQRAGGVATKICTMGQTC